jgi:hypothetical protein
MVGLAECTAIWQLLSIVGQDLGDTGPMTKETSPLIVESLIAEESWESGGVLQEWIVDVSCGEDLGH